MIASVQVKWSKDLKATKLKSYIKNELYLIGDKENCKKVLDAVCDLYSWLDRANQLVNLKIDVVESSKQNHKNKINECISIAENKIKVLKES